MSPRRLISIFVVLVVVLALIAALHPGGPTASIGTNRFATYRITYKVRFSSQGETSEREEDLSVVRPYEGFDLTTAAGGGPSSGAISTDTALYDLRNDGTLVPVGGRQPGSPSGDQDLETQMPELVARHLAKSLGIKASFAGRMCHVFRFFDPPTGELKPLKGDTEYDDICIADGGLILSESWTINGDIAFSRVATNVSRHAGAMPSVASALTPSRQGVPQARLLTGTQSFLRTPVTPSGYRGRPAIAITLPAGQGAATASVVWAFAKGARSISVEAGGPSGQLPWQTGDAVTKRVKLKHLGNATTAIRSDGAEIRVELSRGRWVRIRGTIPLRILVRYANALRLR